MMNEESSSGQQNQQQQPPFSLQSKATSLVKRNTSDLDEDELEYSQSQGTHYFQLEGAIDQPQMASAIDMNFLNDINNECNYLITKFQQVDAGAGLSQEMRRKSQQPGLGTTQQFSNVQSNQAVSESQSQKYALTSQTSAKNQIKSHINIKQPQQFQRDELMKQMKTMNLTNIAGIASLGSNPSGRRTDNQTTYEIKSNGDEAGIHHDNDRSKTEDKSSYAEVDKRLYEETSSKFINNPTSIPDELNEISPAQTLSEQDLKALIGTNANNNTLNFLAPTQQNQLQIQQSFNQQQQLRVITQESNKITFRQEIQQPSTNRTQQELDNAQFDLQNFNAFDQQMLNEGMSEVDFSRAEESSFKLATQEDHHPTLDKPAKTLDFGVKVADKKDMPQMTKDQSKSLMIQENPYENIDQVNNEQKQKQLEIEQVDKEDDYEDDNDSDFEHDSQSDLQQYDPFSNVAQKQPKQNDDEEPAPIFSNNLNGASLPINEMRDDDHFSQDHQEFQLEEEEKSEPEPFHSACQEDTSQKEQSFNDDIIYNRLPKNFFVQEEEHKDLDIVLSSIKQMRQDFMGIMNESKIQEQLEELQNIIQPEKFIQKHLGEESMLFEKVISPKNERQEFIKKHTTQEGMQTEDGPDYEIARTQTDFFEALSQKGNIDEIEERMKNHQKSAIQEEDQESSPEKSKQIYSPPKSTHKTQESPGTIATLINGGRGSQRQYLQGKGSPERVGSGPRQLKMADYFNQSNIQPISPPQNYDDEEEDTLSPEIKEQLVQKLEQEILGNINMNFLFQKGDGLRFSLIDQQRTFKIMRKIKEVAQDQVDNRTKEVDYNEIVRFLKEEELYPDLDQTNNAQVAFPEPTKSKIPQEEVSAPQEQWIEVVDFMRKNPKLLMQMLPDNSDEENEKKVKVTQKATMIQQQDDAKKWGQLQALSKSFLQNRKQFIEAIDQYQIKQSSPKNLQMKERKSIQIKSVTSNQKKLQTAARRQQQQSELPKDIYSDSDYQSKEGGGVIYKSSSTSGQQSRQIQFYKQFQYTSTNVANRIYQNAPFQQLESENTVQQKTSSDQQQIINSNRPIYSQQASRIKGGKGAAAKKVSVSSMADNTTLGTTTGNITNLNQYMFNARDREAMGSQIQTINQDGEQAENGLQNYQPNQIPSQRRPITASAATSQQKSKLMMPLIQQQKDDSFDAKVIPMRGGKKGQRGSRISQQHQMNASDIGQEFANDTQYFSQVGVIEQTLNQSEVMSQPANQSMNININLGPSRKTRMFIHKIAPNLKENELYPKFTKRVRRQAFSKDAYSSATAFHKQRLYGNESVTSSQNIYQLRQQKMLEQQQRMAQQKINQSAANIQDTKEDQEQSYEHTPQGQFPKFIKRQLTSQSQSSRRESQSNYSKLAEAQPAQQQLPVKPKWVNQQMQTRIGGLDNKLLISPLSGNVDPFKFGDGELSQHSEISQAKFSTKHISIPIIDWAFTDLFQKSLDDDVDFNKDQDLSIYVEKEVDYVIDMMKNKYKDFKRSDIMRPFYLKAQQTLKTLFQEQGLVSFYEKMSVKYKEITIENTMKLLIRCKLQFHSRSMILEILKQLINYELSAVEFKNIIDKFEQYRVSQQDFDNIHLAGKSVFDQGHQLLVRIKNLRSVHKQYKTPFIFKKKDYVNYVKSEMNEVKKLLSIFKVKGPEDDNNPNGAGGGDEELNKIEENRNETEEQSFSTNQQD